MDLATSSPAKRRLWLVVGLLALLALGAVAGGKDVVLKARWMIAAAAVVGLAVWVQRRSVAAAGVRAAPRLAVVARAGLSPRCAVALVETGGRSFLVVHGEGAATVHECSFQVASAEPAPNFAALLSAGSARRAGLQ